MAPLDGVIVVTLEQAIAAPLATRHLADLGARVLKIEHPDGGDFARHYDANLGGESTYFVWANRGKESLVLDLKAADDARLLDELIAGADVFVHNISPGAAERAGLGAAGLSELHPHLIACEISGYGLGGPRTGDKAYDLAIQAEAGAVALTGSPEEMSKVGFSVADISAAMYAVSSVLAALHRRQVTGEGAAISLSMLECLTEWTSPQLLTAATTGVEPARSPRRHPMIAPYGIFTLDDGRSILVAVQADREWRALAAEVLDRPELADDSRFATNPARIANVDALESVLIDAFAALGAERTLERLAAARITVSHVRGPLDVWAHEQLAARDRFEQVATPNGEATVLRSPLVADSDGAAPRRVPALGEHDAALVAELRRRASATEAGEHVLE